MEWYTLQQYKPWHHYAGWMKLDTKGHMWFFLYEVPKNGKIHGHRVDFTGRKEGKNGE
jgi:hypothetical protein